MSRQQIDPKKAPILWDTVNEAFEKINNNFVELYLSLGAGGPVDLTDLSTSISPSDTEVYNLGSPTKRWKDLYLSGSSIYLGNAVITASGSAVNLPAGSTIAGSVLDNEYFREIAVAGQSNIVAEAGGSDILTISSGNAGITLTTNPSTDTLTITNSGVVNIVSGNSGISVSGTTTKTINNTGVLDVTTTPGSGISISQPSGSVVITNSGVTRLEAGGGITLDNNTGVVTITNNSPNIVQNLWRFIAVTGYTNLDPISASATLTFEAGDGMNIQSSLALNKLSFINTGVTGIAASGAGISVSAATGSVTVSNTGVTSLAAGSGISISGSTGAVTVTNTRPGFTNIAVQGQSPLQADNETDTVVLIAGTGIELIADPVTDSIIIAAEANIQSSIYSDSSTLLVDAVQGKIVGPIDSFDGGNSIQMDPVNGVILGGTGGVTLLGAASAPIYIGYGSSGTTTGDIYIGNAVGSRTIYFENPTSGISYNDLSDLPNLGNLGGGGGGGGDFELNVASDDSTIRRIFSGETLKFIGTGGITTSSDAEGHITISGAALTSLAGRGDVFGTSVSLTNGATGNITITGFKGYMMYKITTSAAAWVRIYTSTSARTADSGRVEGTDPTPGSGVIAEVVTTGAETVLMSPGVVGFNNESIPNSNIEVAVTNKSGGTTTITVTLTIVKLES